jgi:glycosidase
MGSTQVWTAHTEYYKYDVYTGGRNYELEYVFRHYRENLGKLHKSLSEAQAAAQADYEARTAERFRKVEMPSKRKYQENDSPELIFTIHGYNTAIDALMDAIAKAKEQQ